MKRRADGRNVWSADAEYAADSDGWVACRFCSAPIERSGFADPITGGDGYWHCDGSDVCLTPQPARTLEKDQ